MNNQSIKTLAKAHGTPVRLLIAADGTLTPLLIKRPYRDLLKMMGASITDTVSMVDGDHVMLVDDKGHEKALPVNAMATALYWEKCGGVVDHEIRGAVVVVPDEDFA